VPRPASRLAGFLAELRRRKVFSAAASYAVVAWVLLQVGEVTFEPLGVPAWGMTALIVLVVALFPVALVVSWFFDLTLRGFRKDPRSRSSDTASIDETSGTSRAGAGPARPASVAASIAVLPFDDLSRDRDQAYLCDGIAEEVLNRLARIRNLRVASRTTSFRFRGQPLGASEIGRKLHVATVLEGSVRKDRNQLRITTQLIDVASGFHLWSSSFDRELADIFDIQREIATQVAAALEVKLKPRPDDGSCATEDARAYDFFLRGQHFFRRWGTRNMTFAIRMFSRAVEVDPSYARAWAALADSYAMTCMYWNASDENRAAADRASARALELSPGLAECHASRGVSHFVNGDADAAIAEFETSRRLDPDLFEAWYFYGRVCFQRGEIGRAAELFEQAERLDPDDFQAPIFLRQIYHSLGRPDDARAAAKRGVERAERHLELNPDDTRALNLAIGGHASLGNVDKVRDFARRSLELDGENADTLYNVACGYALIGDADAALDCLENASMTGMAIAGWAENDSDLESLRDMPRFRDLIRRLRQQETGPRSAANP
jgi:adenylate cyclase